MVRDSQLKGIYIHYLCKQYWITEVIIPFTVTNFTYLESKLSPRYRSKRR